MQQPQPTIKMSIPAPTHVLMTCVECECPVLKAYSPQIPLAFYRHGCRRSCSTVINTCRCVFMAFIGKTSDGDMAYYDIENYESKKDIQNLFWAHGVGSDGVEVDPWTGTVPHHVNFGGRIQLDNFAIQTYDDQFHRYFTGENKDIARLELDPALFSRQLTRQPKYSEEPEEIEPKPKNKNQMW